RRCGDGAGAGPARATAAARHLHPAPGKTIRQPQAPRRRRRCGPVARHLPPGHARRAAGGARHPHATGRGAARRPAIRPGLPMNRPLYHAAFAAGLAALVWIGYGYLGAAYPLALGMTAVVAAFYLMGAW